MRLLTDPLCTILLSLLTGSSFATLLNSHDWSNAHKLINSHQNLYQLKVNEPLIRVDESWRSNASESCNSHRLSQLSSSFNQGLLTIHEKDLTSYVYCSRKVHKATCRGIPEKCLNGCSSRDIPRGQVSNNSFKQESQDESACGMQACQIRVGACRAG